VVTSTIAFEGDGLWREYEGGVQDWLQSKSQPRPHCRKPVRSGAAQTRSNRPPKKFQTKTHRSAHR
jgi:ATP-binding cassette subfamily F protein uup